MQADEKLFMTFRSIIKKWMKIVDRKLLPLGITHAEARLLSMIYEDDGCGQDQLASRMDVDRSNVGRALKKMEDLDFIKRPRNEKDARAFKIFVTEKGWALQERIKEIQAKLIELITKEITESELKTLTGLLNIIDRNLNEEN